MMVGSPVIGRGNNVSNEGYGGVRLVQNRALAGINNLYCAQVKRFALDIGVISIAGRVSD